VQGAPCTSEKQRNSKFLTTGIRIAHEITSESQNKSQNQTCQVKTKPGRSKA